MKAIVYNKYGSVENLSLTKVERPQPKDKEVLIKLHAAAINSWDWDLVKGTLQGRIFGLFQPKFKILGADIAGIVVGKGKDVVDFQVGDEVFGDVSAYNWGGFAEYVCADEKFLIHKPKHLTFEQAAATPQAGVLAYQGLAPKKTPLENRQILINGAGGGVGTFAIQMAKTHGAEVTVVDKGNKLNKLVELGADYVIDFQKEDYTKRGKQYDLIIDNIAKRSVKDYSRALKKDGIFRMIGGATGSILQVLIQGGWISKMSEKQIGIVAHEPTREHLNALNDLTATGNVSPIIDKTFSLEETKEAFYYYERGDFVGKIVITMNS